MLHLILNIIKQIRILILIKNFIIKKDFILLSHLFMKFKIQMKAYLLHMINHILFVRIYIISLKNLLMNPTIKII